MEKEIEAREYRAGVSSAAETGSNAASLVLLFLHLIFGWVIVVLDIRTHASK